jgi:hypothetical protein
MMRERRLQSNDPLRLPSSGINTRYVCSTANCGTGHAPSTDNRPNIGLDPPNRTEVSMFAGKVRCERRPAGLLAGMAALGPIKLFVAVVAMNDRVSISREIAVTSAYVNHTNRQEW